MVLQISRSCTLKSFIDDQQDLEFTWKLTGNQYSSQSSSMTWVSIGAAIPICPVVFWTFLKWLAEQPQYVAVIQLLINWLRHVYSIRILSSKNGTISAQGLFAVKHKLRVKWFPPMYYKCKINWLHLINCNIFFSQKWEKVMSFIQIKLCINKKSLTHFKSILYLIGEKTF